VLYVLAAGRAAFTAEAAATARAGPAITLARPTQANVAAIASSAGHDARIELSPHPAVAITTAPVPFRR
jgi:hypothetical protein